MPYTEEQLAFLDHDPNQSCRVLAGPGTGKSFASVAYLEKVTTAEPELRVGYITFTRAATAEFAKKMQDSKLMALGGRPPQTMHGFSLSLLLKHQSSRIPYPLRIIDSWEERNLVNPDISRSLKAKGYIDASPRLVARLQAELAAGLQSLDRAALPLSAERPDLVNAYRGVWSTNRILYGYTLLSELPYQAGGVLEDLDESTIDLDLLIVDEYQDLNFADQRVLTEVSRRHVAIVGIGDDDQSIYGWRNAAPIGIREFLTTFGTQYDYPLTISQRCGGEALRAASDLIELDSERPRKRRLSASERTPATGFHYFRFKSNAEEGQGIAKIIANRVNSGVSPGEVVILVRSSVPKWRRELEPILAQYDIPTSVGGDINDLMAEPGLRRALSLARLVVDPDDSLAWRTILHLTPGVGPTLVEKVSAASSAKRFSTRLKEVHANGWASINRSTKAKALVSETMEWLGTAPVSASAAGGWARWLADLSGPEGLSESARMVVESIADQLGEDVELRAFLNDFEPTAKEVLSGAVDGVRIMTMGMSKGLTVNTAIIVGIDSNIIPAPRGEWDEELRLLYVAFTRATALTVACFTSRRIGETARIGSASVKSQREQSPFMTALPNLAPEDGLSFVSTI